MAQSTKTNLLFALLVIAIAVFTYSVLIASPMWGAVVSLAGGYVAVRTYVRLHPIR